MKRLTVIAISIIAVVALICGATVVMAAKPPSVIPFSNGFPSGMHFNLNIHGKDPATFTCPSGPPPYGNSIFIPEYTSGYTAEEMESVTIEIVSDKKSSVTELTVLDPCAMPIGYPDGDGATVQLPYKIQVDEGSNPINALGYYVYGRILGKPNNSNKGDPENPESSIILTPRPVLNFDYTDLNGVDWLLGLVTTNGVYRAENNTWVRFETQEAPKKGKSKAQDITDLFMWSGWVCDVWLDQNGDGVVDDADRIQYNADYDPDYDTFDDWITAMAALDLATYYEDWWVFDVADIVAQTWDIENDGTKLLQIRFYPVATTEFTEEAHISVEKVTDPGTDTTTSFDFTMTMTDPPGDTFTFSLKNGHFKLLGPLEPGDYVITEIEPMNWDASFSVIDPTTGSSSGTGNSVTVHLDVGETIIVTFLNTYVPPE